MTVDKNKGITVITYNELGKVKLTATFEGTGWRSKRTVYECSDECLVYAGDKIDHSLSTGLGIQEC